MYNIVQSGHKCTNFLHSISLQFRMKTVFYYIYFFTSPSSSSSSHCIGILFIHSIYFSFVQFPIFQSFCSPYNTTVAHSMNDSFPPKSTEMHHSKLCNYISTLSHLFWIREKKDTKMRMKRGVRHSSMLQNRNLINIFILIQKRV